ncbi:MAG: DUF4412 domain-containing protein [Gemmatimonadota bacterium]
MRRFALLLILLPAGSLAAQQFEGTIVVRSGGPGGTGAMLWRMTTKGQKVLNVTTLPGIGQEMRMITDNHAGTLTTMTPFPPGMALPPGVANAKGVVKVEPLPKQANGKAPKSDIRKLGTTQMIAGLRCTDYEVTSDNGQTIRMCLTTSLGAMANGAIGGGNPEWGAAPGGKPTMPLKIWRPGGATLLEVVEVKRELVSPRAFDIPAGYVDIATAMKNRSLIPKP